MYIFTDSTKNSNRLISGNHQWKKPHDEKHFNREFHKLVSKLINQPSFTKVDTELSWHSLIHTKHTQFSQFDILTNLAKHNSNLPDGILCHADSGQNFHGQKNRSWNAQEGNIHLSIYLTPNISPEKMNSTFLTLGVASILETIDSFPELEGKAMIKWPNDIFIGQAKVGGILTQCFTSENKVRAVVLGVGLNVEIPPQISGDKFTPQAGCLKDHSKSINFNSVFLALLKSLYTYYRLANKNRHKQSFDLYNKRSLIVGKNCSVYTSDETKPDFKGKVIGLGDDLELIFENNSQVIRSGRLEILS